MADIVFLNEVITATGRDPDITVIRDHVVQDLVEAGCRVQVDTNGAVVVTVIVADDVVAPEL